MYFDINLLQILPVDDTIFLDTFLKTSSFVGAFAKSSRETSEEKIPESTLKH
jgi:hypothetical protein